MQRLEVSGAVRPIYRSLGVKGLIAGIAGSNIAKGMNVRHLGLFVCCAGGGLCDELIAHAKDSCRMCVFV